MNKALIVVILVSVFGQIAHAEKATLRATQATVSKRGEPASVRAVSDCILRIVRSPTKILFALSSASTGLVYKGEMDTTQIPLPKQFYAETDKGDFKPYVGSGTSIGISDSKQIDLRVRKMTNVARIDNILVIDTNPVVTEITSAKGTTDYNPFHGKEIYTDLECKFEP